MAKKGVYQCLFCGKETEYKMLTNRGKKFCNQDCFKKWFKKNPGKDIGNTKPILLRVYEVNPPRKEYTYKISPNERTKKSRFAPTTKEVSQKKRQENDIKRESEYIEPCDLEISTIQDIKTNYGKMFLEIISLKDQNQKLIEIKDKILEFSQTLSPAPATSKYDGETDYVPKHLRKFPAPAPIVKSPEPEKKRGRPLAQDKFTLEEKEKIMQKMKKSIKKPVVSSENLLIPILPELENDDFPEPEEV